MHLFDQKYNNNFWRIMWQWRLEYWGTFKFTPVPNVLLRFLGWTTCFLETVCNGIWDTFSLVWWVCQKCQPNQQQRVYKPSGIKETARTMGPSEVVYKCVHCSSVYATIEDIRRQIAFPNNVLVSQFHGWSLVCSLPSTIYLDASLSTVSMGHNT